MSVAVDDAPWYNVNRWDYPFASLGALALASMGVKKWWAYYYAVVAQFIYWMGNYKGLDGITNAIVGIQFGRGVYHWGMFASLLSLWEVFQDSSVFEFKKGISYKNTTRLLIYAVGYLLGRFS